MILPCPLFRLDGLAGANGDGAGRNAGRFPGLVKRAGCFGFATISNGIQWGRGQKHLWMRTHRPAVKRRVSAIRNEPSAVKRQASAIRNEPSAVRRRASAIKNEPSAVKRQASAIRNEPSAAKRRVSPIKNEPSAVKRQPSAAEGRFRPDRLPHRQ